MSLFEKTDHPILTPCEELPWASGAVFNPGAWYEDGTVHLLFRAIPGGYRRVPLADPEPFGPAEGFDESYVSFIGYACSANGVDFTCRDVPLLVPDSDFDRYGAEDPRISRLGDQYLITYTALSQPAFGPVDGVRIGLASTKDFRTVAKFGVVGPDVRDKDAVIFPRLIGGRIGMLHRIVPNIQVAFFEDLEHLCARSDAFWNEHLETLDEHIVMSRQADWESKKIGVGATPVETPEGWLVVYHGVDDNHVYRAGLALLDLDDPKRVIARTTDPVMEPELDFERVGDVDNVVFPEGAVVIDGVLHLYYGAADSVVAHAQAALTDVLDYVLER